MYDFDRLVNTILESKPSLIYQDPNELNIEIEQRPEARRIVDQYKERIKKGEELLPILVRVERPSLIIDGNHRAQAYKELGQMAPTFSVERTHALIVLGTYPLHKAYEILFQQPIHEGLSKTLAAGALGIAMLADPKPSQSQPPTTIEHTTQVNVKQAMDFIKPHEGYSKVLYYVQGIPHIGVGFNLTRPDAKLLLAKVGAHLNLILKGKESLTDEQIYQLFEHDVEQAIKGAYTYIPNLSSHPYAVQLAIVDMAYNLGNRGLASFKELKKALLKRDYHQAASEMIASKWYTQVGLRAKHLVSMVRDA